MTPQDPSSHATLGRLELRYPPLPQTLLEATRLIDEPQKIEVGPVTEMVQRDPIVIAKLLHIVNSAYYGLRYTINSVERTVVMLGPVAVTGIVIGMNMLKLDALLDKAAAKSFEQIVRHSLATAFMTRHIMEGDSQLGGSREKNNRVGVSFTAGLMHDFGKIILVYNFPEEASELYTQDHLDQQVTEPDTRNLEQLLFGFDHTEAGEYVARKLGFPDVLTDVIRYHHEPMHPTGNPETDRLVRATAAANKVVKAIGYDLEQTLEWAQVEEDPLWDLILQQDMGQKVTKDTLFKNILQQKDHLDHYVETMMATQTSRSEAPLPPTDIGHSIVGIKRKRSPLSGLGNKV